MRSTSAAVVMAVLFTASSTARGGIWDRAFDARPLGFEQTLARAEAELATRHLAGAPLDAAARAEALAVDALKARPDDVRALAILGEARALAGRPAAAAVAFERAANRANSSADEGRFAIRAAAEHVRARDLEAALAAYDRAARLGRIDVLASAGAVLLALDRPEEAEVRFRWAMRATTALPRSPERSERAAFALAGLALATELCGRGSEAAREALAPALALDPQPAWLRRPDVELDAGGEGPSFLGAGEAELASALLLELLGREAEARDRLVRAATLGAERPWAAAVRARARRASPVEVSKPAPALRLAAAATLHADGPLPAPIIDAAWRARSDLIDVCMGGEGGRPADLPTSAVRLAFDLVIGPDGRVRDAAPHHAPAGAQTLAACIADAIEVRLVTVRPSRAKDTRARVELLVVPAAPP